MKMKRRAEKKKANRVVMTKCAIILSLSVWQVNGSDDESIASVFIKLFYDQKRVWAV